MNNPFVKERPARRVAPGRARDFGLDKPYSTSPDIYTRAACDALAASLLVNRGYCDHSMLTIRPRASNPESLAGRVEKLLRKFAYGWGRRHAVGPDRESAWLEYFVVVGRNEANHASHGHVVLLHELDATDRSELRKLAAQRDLDLQFSDNSQQWLDDHPSVVEHASKVHYAVSHLQQRGATWRSSGGGTPEWVRGSRARFLAARKLRSRIPESIDARRT